MKPKVTYWIASLCILLQLSSFAKPESGPASPAPPLQATTAADAKEEPPRPRTFEPFGHAFSIQDDPNYVRQMLVRPEAIDKLDRLLSRSVEQGVFPGCQVYASRNGVIVYHKSFGNYTYDPKALPVTNTTLYDMASVTKILATTLAVMKLTEDGKINLQHYLKNYLPFLKDTDKGNITIQDLLLHQGGLKSWIPFYRKTLDTLNGMPRVDLFASKSIKGYNIPVARNFYMRNNYLQVVWQEILDSPLENLGRYVYSDLDFYFLKEVVEAVSGKAMDAYLREHFYAPMGLQNLVFNPWKKGWLERCAPTEKDDYFRLQTIQGYVHDQGAAMLGGVAGHAGLFATSADMAVLLQMLLNGGVYKGDRYLKKATIQNFTAYHSALSRRGLGFDKPEKSLRQGGPASELCSKTTFGHQGFTGTCAWADPATGIVFIFLSNRVYPSAENSLINRQNTRIVAQQYIYEALGYGK